jgi:hypothetical protein
MRIVNMGAFIKGFKAFTWKVVVIIQKILISIILFFLYFIGFGVMFVLTAVFRRSLFRRGNTHLSSWLANPAGYDITVDGARRES